MQWASIQEDVANYALLKLTTRDGLVGVTKLASKNRNVTFDHGGQARLTNVAGDGYTTVTINGQRVDEEALKVGMTCEITHEGDKTAAQKIVCD